MIKYRIVWFIRNSDFDVQFLWLLKIYFAIKLKNIFEYFKSLILKLTYDETIKILWIRHTAANQAWNFTIASPNRVFRFRQTRMGAEHFGNLSITSVFAVRRRKRFYGKKRMYFNGRAFEARDVLPNPRRNNYTGETYRKTVRRVGKTGQIWF